MGRDARGAGAGAHIASREALGPVRLRAFANLLTMYLTMHLTIHVSMCPCVQVRLLVYANSFLADPEAAAPPGTETVTAARWRRSLFAEAVAEGYTVAASTVADTIGTGTAAARQALESASPTASKAPTAPKARGDGKATHLLESAGFKAALLDVTHPQAWPHLHLVLAMAALTTAHTTAHTVAALTVAALTVAALTVAALAMAGARVDGRECAAGRTAHPRAGRHSK